MPLNVKIGNDTQYYTQVCEQIKLEREFFFQQYATICKSIERHAKVWKSMKKYEQAVESVKKYAKVRKLFKSM